MATEVVAPRQEAAPKRNRFTFFKSAESRARSGRSRDVVLGLLTGKSLHGPQSQITCEGNSTILFTNWVKRNRESPRRRCPYEVCGCVADRQPTSPSLIPRAHSEDRDSGLSVRPAA